MRSVGTRTEWGLIQDLLDRFTSLVAVASPVLAAVLDWTRPSLHSTWGGPMNGQAGRREIVRQLTAQVRPEAVVEAGTFRGDTTAFLADVTGSPVHTVEASRRFHVFARWRLGRDDVHLTLADSRAFLRAFDLSAEVVFFYLDAHWEEDLPLKEELEIIAARFPRSIVMVDDFEVPADAGYGFDDYGPGVVLTEEILPDAVRDWTRLYPRLASRHETGACRGCVVLVPPAWDSARLARAAGLRASTTPYPEGPVSV